VIKEKDSNNSVSTASPSSAMKLAMRHNNNNQSVNISTKPIWNSLFNNNST